MKEIKIDPKIKITKIKMKVSGFIILGIELIDTKGDVFVSERWGVYPPIGKWASLDIIKGLEIIGVQAEPSKEGFLPGVSFLLWKPYK